MPDREKYIEILINTVEMAKRMYNNDAPIKISLECVEDILSLLKEQEAIEPRRDAICVRMFRCGACREYVGFIDSDHGDPNEQDNYCRNCGRPVLWEGR